MFTVIEKESERELATFEEKNFPVILKDSNL